MRTDTSLRPEPGAAGMDRDGSSLVLVVGASPVNCVVVSRVVERMGLRVISERPQEAAATLLSKNPSIVILDGGAQNRDCDLLLDDLLDRRSGSIGALPAVIFLASANCGMEDDPFAPVVDMVVVKPLTIDRLQPAIEALRARNGDFAQSPA